MIIELWRKIKRLVLQLEFICNWKIRVDKCSDKKNELTLASDDLTLSFQITIVLLDKVMPPQMLWYTHGPMSTWILPMDRVNINNRLKGCSFFNLFRIFLRIENKYKGQKIFFDCEIIFIKIFCCKRWKNSYYYK